MRAIAIVAQNPAHGPALAVAIDAVLPGIDAFVAVFPASEKAWAEL